MKQLCNMYLQKISDKITCIKKVTTSLNLKWPILIPFSEISNMIGCLAKYVRGSLISKIDQIK